MLMLFFVCKGNYVINMFAIAASYNDNIVVYFFCIFFYHLIKMFDLIEMFQHFISLHCK